MSENTSSFYSNNLCAEHEDLRSSPQDKRVMGLILTIWVE